MTSPRKDPIRIAIVGSGLSGLAVAHFLNSASASSSPASGGPSFEVHIFERAPKLGMDSSSIDVPNKVPGQPNVRVDVPMRSFNSGYYPHVLRLYRQLGIPIRRSDFTYSFAVTPQTPVSGDGTPSGDGPAGPAPSPVLIYNGASGVRGFGLPSSLRLRVPKGGASSSPADLAATLPDHLSAVRAYLATILTLTLAYLHLLGLALWHHYLGHTRDPKHPLARRTFGEWAASKRINRRFVEGAAVPLFSAVMTSQASSVREAPVAEILDYVAATFLRSHYTVATGVREVENALSTGLGPEQVHVGATVTAVRPSGPGGDFVSITFSQGGREDGERASSTTLDGFRHVILATQANQAAFFVDGYLGSVAATARNGASVPDARLQRLALMRDRLQRHKYEPSTVINHTDGRLLPKDEADWRDLNLVTPVLQGQAAAAIASANGSASAHQAIEAILVPGKDGAQARFVTAATRGGGKQAAALVAAASMLGAGPVETQTMATHVVARDFDGVSSPHLEGGGKRRGEGAMLLQTTNALSQLMPSEGSVLSVSTFERVILSSAGKAAQKGLYEWKRVAGRLADDPLALGSPRSNNARQKLVESIKRKTPKGRWQLRLGTLQGGFSTPGSPEAGIWACGSWSPGIPLLEGCVTSARLVVAEIVGLEKRRARTSSA